MEDLAAKVQSEPYVRTVHTTERRTYIVQINHLNLMLDELWAKTNEIRETSKLRNYASIRFMYKEESPVGINTLPYDWAKLGKRYNNINSLEGTRLELIVDAKGKKRELDFGCLMVITKKDDDTAIVHVNKIDSYIDPSSFYEIVDKHSSSQQQATKDAPEYISKFKMYFNLLRYRLKGEANLFGSMIKDMKEKLKR